MDVATAATAATVATVATDPASTGLDIQGIATIGIAAGAAIYGFVKAAQTLGFFTRADPVAETMEELSASARSIAQATGEISTAVLEGMAKLSDRMDRSEERAAVRFDQADKQLGTIEKKTSDLLSMHRDPASIFATGRLLSNDVAMQGELEQIKSATERIESELREQRKGTG